MSSHRLDVSGSRPLTTTLNDPAATSAQTSAKAGDDVRFQVGGAREARVLLPPGAKIQRRQYVARTQKLDGGKIVRDDAGAYVYDERTYEQLYLVLPGGATVFARSSDLGVQADDDTSGLPPVHELTPHTTLYARRLGQEYDFSESGELLEELVLAEHLPWTDPA